MSWLSKVSSAVTNSFIKQQTGSSPGSTVIPKSPVSLGSIAANTTNSIVKQQTGLDPVTGNVSPAVSASGVSSGLRSSSDQTGSYGYYDPVSAAPAASGGGYNLPTYPNAALASLYGMSQETAYQEALANTAIQRRMADFKAAGLNPVLAANYNNGAAVFSGDVGTPLSFGGGYASDVAATTSGSGAYSPSGGTTSAKKGIDAAKLLKDYNFRSGVSAVVSGLTMAVTKSFQAGAAAYYFSNAALNAISRRH